MTLVVNLFAGPGAGKSTTSAFIFAKLKTFGVSCELAREYVKDAVWEGRPKVLEYQNYIFAKQTKRVRDLVGQVDVVVTDSPLLLSVVYNERYGAEPPSFVRYVWDVHNSFDNLNVYVHRSKPYVTSGRLQTEDQAIELDVETHLLPLTYDLEVPGTEQGADMVVDKILMSLR